MFDQNSASEQIAAPDNIQVLPGGPQAGAGSPGDRFLARAKKIALWGYFSGHLLEKPVNKWPVDMPRRTKLLSVITGTSIATLFSYEGIYAISVFSPPGILSVSLPIISAPIIGIFFFTAGPAITRSLVEMGYVPIRLMDRRFAPQAKPTASCPKP